MTALHPYVFTGYVTAIVTLVVGLFVWRKNTSSSIHRSFLMFSLSITEWSFFTALSSMLYDPVWSLLWSKLCHIGGMFIPIFFYYFTLKITGRSSVRALKTGFLLATVLVVFLFTCPLFISGTRPIGGLPNFAKAGPLYFLSQSFFTVYVLWSLWHLWDEIRMSSGTRKKHLEYFFLSSVLGFAIGMVNFMPVYGLIFFPFPYSTICGALYEVVIAYAILKHKLFDIELIIKRGLVFGVLFVMVYAAVSAMIFFAGLFMAGKPLAILSGTSIAVAMLLYEPLKALLTRLTQRFLFQNKMDGLVLIQQLTNRLTDIRDVETLSKAMTGFLTREMALEWAGLYLAKANRAEFILQAAEGQLFRSELNEEDAAMILARKSRTPLLLNPFDVAGNITAEEKIELRHEKIEAIVPIYLEGSLYAVILVGKKKSDHDFTREDEALLATLAEEAVMFFLSAKLLAEATRAQLELGQKMKMAAVKQLSRGVHHEIRNPLHAMVLAASHIIEECEKGHLAGMERETLTAIFVPRLDAMLEDIQRIKETLSRFARFARPEEDSNLVPLQLKEEVGKFLVLMEEGQKLDRIRVDARIPEGLCVMASEGALQEILFNLFTNAYDAMKGAGGLLLEAREKEGFVVELRMRDFGPGIPADLLPRIFEPYFSTKSRSESAGIGLAITKHHIEKMGGTIEVNAPAGKGAEFILRFPKAVREEALRCA